MRIDTSLLLPATALISSLLLLVAGKKRVFEIVAVIASVLWLGVHLGLLVWPIKHVGSALAIGGTLLVTGVIVYLSTENKREVTASTVLAILGGVLLLGAFGRG